MNLLRAASTRSGNTTLAGGTLKVTGGRRLYSGAQSDMTVVTVGSGATLELDM